jgi:hypothetical protein
VWKNWYRFVGLLRDLILVLAGPTYIPFFSTFGLFFYPEDEDIRFLQNSGEDLPDYVGSCTKKQ